MLTMLERHRGAPSVLPPRPDTVAVNIRDSEPAIVATSIDDAGEPSPISAFVCVIDYEGEVRFVTCRRYDVIGDVGYIGAICHTAKGYRQFCCDRIATVSDACTGEVLGDGRYFARFEPQTVRSRAPSWGLTPSRKATLVAGLNVLAFMARCDGYWHPLEVEPVERFVCSMWLRKEWENEPPLGEIVAHAQRLAPDADTFFKALNHYARSSTSSQVLKRAIGDLIAADGVICDAETSWVLEIPEYLDAWAPRWAE